MRLKLVVVVMVMVVMVTVGDAAAAATATTNGQYCSIPRFYIFSTNIPRSSALIGRIASEPAQSGSRSAKGSDTLESFLSKVAFESDFRMKSCTCVMKTFAIFFFRNEILRLEHVLFCEFLSKVTFETNFRKKTFSCVTTLSLPVADPRQNFARRLQ